MKNIQKNTIDNSGGEFNTLWKNFPFYIAKRFGTWVVNEKKAKKKEMRNLGRENESSLESVRIRWARTQNKKNVDIEREREREREGAREID